MDNNREKQIDVSFPCVCPVIHNEFRHNIVKVAVDPRGDSITGQTHEKTVVNLLNHQSVIKWLSTSSSISDYLTNRSNVNYKLNSLFKVLSIFRAF